MKKKTIFLYILLLIIFLIIIYIIINRYNPIKSWCKKYDTIEPYKNDIIDLDGIIIDNSYQWNTTNKNNARICCRNNIDVANNFCEGGKDSKYIYNKHELIGKLINNKKTILISMRGTLSIDDMFVDLKQKLISIYNNNNNNNIKVHKGFYYYIKEIENEIYNRINKILDKNQITDIVLTGHSLGSGSATLLTYYLALKYPTLNITSYLFASPRVGNAEFVNDYNSKSNINTYSIMNLYDVIPNLPNLDKKYIHVKCLDKKKGKIVFNSTGSNAEENHSIFRYNDNIDKSVFI